MRPHQQEFIDVLNNQGRTQFTFCKEVIDLFDLFTEKVKTMRKDNEEEPFEPLYDTLMGCLYMICKRTLLPLPFHIINPSGLDWQAGEDMIHIWWRRGYMPANLRQLYEDILTS